VRASWPAVFVCVLGLAGIARGDDVIVTGDQQLTVDASPLNGEIVMGLRGGIWTLPADGGRAIRVTGTGLTATRPRWSPDGIEILFESRQPDGTELWVFDRSTNETARIGGNEFHNQNPSWHPQGDRIVFSSDRLDTGLDIWEMDVPTGLAWRLTMSAGDELEPAWSRDGRHLAWISRTDAGYALMLRRHGEQDMALLQSESPLSSPSWRPDNSLLTVLRHAADGKSLAMVILSEPVLVRTVPTREELTDAPVSWPDRMTMVYSAGGKIRIRGFDDRRSRPLHFSAIIAPSEPAPVAIPARRELPLIDAPDETFVIRGARLFDGVWKGYRQNMDVVVDSGRVAAVEARRDREGMTVLDVGDVTIIPGFIDALSAAGGNLESGPAILAYGVTTIVADTAGMAFDPARWESELTPGPRLLSSSEFAGGTPTSIADAASPGVKSLLTSRQVTMLGQALRTSRRFAETPSAASLASPVVIGSRPNRMSPGLALHAELRALVAAGMSNEQALFAAGKNSAAFLGLDNQVGTIIAGGFADMVLVRGDPLGDIANTLDIVAVVRNGRFYSLISLLERATKPPGVE
jgi:hypothetical protein